MKKYTTILFASDKSYAPHLATAIYSLLKNNKDIGINIKIFTCDLGNKDQDILREICEKFEVSIDFAFLSDELFEGLVLNHHFKKSNYYRLFAADLINAEKCLYLDADIIITRSISGLLSVDLGDSYLAAVENPGFNRHEELGMKSDSLYFNSGVMLLNLKRWRKSNLKDSVINLVKNKPSAIHFVDQCGLNGIVDGEWIELDSKYNRQTCMLMASICERNHSGELPVVVHYTGSSKPWHMANNHPYKNLYWHYRNQTPYRSMLPDDFSLLNLVKYLLPVKLKKAIKNLIGIPAT